MQNLKCSQIEKLENLNNTKIKDIVNKYSKMIDEIKNQTLPNLPIMDGDINKFDFKGNDKWYNYSFYNLAYYSKEDLDNNKFLSLLFLFFFLPSLLFFIWMQSYILSVQIICTD